MLRLPRQRAAVILPFTCAALYTMSLVTLLRALVPLANAHQSRYSWIIPIRSKRVNKVLIDNFNQTNMEGAIPDSTVQRLNRDAYHCLQASDREHDEVSGQSPCRVRHCAPEWLGYKR